MNEVTKIHLGRQAFTISVDAHHELKNYLDAIKKQVGDKDVVEEIELRMAELLGEHGVSKDKVVLPGDVDFLKEQLGNPKDFSEDGDETSAAAPERSESKRLFRDTENAMVAGVAAGLAQYFGVDVLLVRILFIVAVFLTFGWGILLYILLWILVPEAKTASDRLQMAGKQVNVGSLKEIAERADVKGAARRANATIAGPVNSLFRFILKLIGLFFILSGLSVLFGLVATETYLLINRATWVQNNIFPIGFREHLLLDIAVVVAGLMAVFVILFGVAMFGRKWPIRTWVTGMLVGLIFLGVAVVGALTGDVYPNIRNRYNANVHTTIRTLPPFSSVHLSGKQADIDYQVSDKSYVSLTYYDNPNLGSIKTSVKNGTLLIDTSQFDEQRNCQTICIPDTYNLTMTVYSPNAPQLDNLNVEMPIKPPAPVYQP